MFPKCERALPINGYAMVSGDMYPVNQNVIILSKNDFKKSILMWTFIKKSYLLVLNCEVDWSQKAWVFP